MATSRADQDGAACSSSSHSTPTHTVLQEKERQLPQLVQQLKQRMRDTQPLADEPQYFLHDDTLARFVRARDYNVKEAEKQLRYAVEWRRKNRPLNTVCRACRKKPGLHSIRQVGFDLEGRPVIYACFAQCSSLKGTVEDTVEHVVALCENCIASFQENSPPSWTWVIDCRGVTLGCCNPAIAQEVLGVLSACYPEYLHRVVLTNHNALFHNFWKLIRVFIDPKSIDKVKFVRKRDKLALCFQSMFPRQLSDWLLEELRLNALDDLPLSQKLFYLPPPTSAALAHDPRGSPDYVLRFLLPFPQLFLKQQQLLAHGLTVPARVHQPHPNICDQLLAAVAENTQLANNQPDSSEAVPNGYGVASTDTNTNTNTNTNTRSSTNAKVVTVTKSGTTMVTDTNSDTNTRNGTNGNLGNHTRSDTNTSNGANGNFGNNTKSDTNTRNGTNGNLGNNTNSDTNTRNGANGNVGSITKSDTSTTKSDTNTSHYFSTITSTFLRGNTTSSSNSNNLGSRGKSSENGTTNCDNDKAAAHSFATNGQLGVGISNADTVGGGGGGKVNGNVGSVSPFPERKTSKDVADTVIESLSVATNKISSFFRELA